MLQAPIEGYEDAIVDLLRQCPYHRFSELHQLYTFYNALNPNDHDALDSVAGGNFLDKIPRECLSIIESKSNVRYSKSRVTDVRANANANLPNSQSNSFDLQQIAAALEDKLDIRMNRFEKSLNEMKNSIVTPTAPLKAVTEVYVTCGSNHNYNQCPLTRGGNDYPVFHDNIQQFQTAAVGNFIQNRQNLSNQTRPPGFHQPAQKSTSLVESDIQTNATMADNRTMAQMLQAPIEGYKDAIVVPPINANNFELKQTLINLIQSNQFTGRQDPHNHLRFFNKVTSTFRHPEVPNTTVKLLLFPFSLEGEARIWLDKEPARSILTWEDLVSKFINQFFPPSKTTYLRNEITNFLQKSNETFNEAWERFKDLLRQCPHHGFSELHQLDTFYNALNPNDQDTLDSAAGGNFLDKIPRECLSIIESKSKVRYSRSRVTDLDIRMNRFEKSLNEMKNSIVTPTAPLKAVTEVCVTCGSIIAIINVHSPEEGMIIRNLNQNRQPNQGALYQNRPPQNPNFQALPQQNAVTQEKFEAYTTANDANMNNLQLKFDNFPRNQQDFQKKFEQKQDDFQNQMMQFMQNIYNKPSTSSSSLPSNTILNPKGEAKAITTRSGMSYREPPIPPTGVNQQEPVEATKDTEPQNFDDIHPPIVQAEVQVDKPTDEPIVVIPKAKPNLPYPS
nr:reverse transcriptase domain-containing protein [Tanacetum cinerariifolium]